jgi:hypothetical protein
LDRSQQSTVEEEATTKLNSKMNGVDDDADAPSPSSNSDLSYSETDNSYRGNFIQPLDDTFIPKQISLSSGGQVRKVSATVSL